MGNSNTVMMWNNDNHTYRAKVSPRGEIVSEIDVYPHSSPAFPEGKVVKRFRTYYLEVQT